MLEPVLVTPRDGNYLLISGERRLLACGAPGMERIPARVFDVLEAKAEILTIQLAENLQREDLDPIDAANLANPGLRKARESFLEAPMMQAQLEQLLASFVKTPGTAATVKTPPFAGLFLSMRNTKISFTKRRVYPQADLEKLRDDLKSATDLVGKKTQALRDRQVDDPVPS